MIGMWYKARMGWSHVGRSQRTCQERGEGTDDTRLHRLQGAQLWVGLRQLVGLPGKALSQDAPTSLRFVVHAAGWLQSMVLHGCWCFCRRYLAMCVTVRCIPEMVTSSLMIAELRSGWSRVILQR